MYITENSRKLLHGAPGSPVGRVSDPKSRGPVFETRTGPLMVGFGSHLTSSIRRDARFWITKTVILTIQIDPYKTSWSPKLRNNSTKKALGTKNIRKINKFKKKDLSHFATDDMKSSSRFFLHITCFKSRLTFIFYS